MKNTFLKALVIFTCGGRQKFRLMKLYFVADPILYQESRGAIPC